MRILLDSNVWRYLVDAGAIGTLRRALSGSRHVVAIAPSVFYEAAHTGDQRLRNELLTTMKSPTWKRLMPEVYSEAEELKGEVRRLHPEWLRAPADLSLIRRLRHDWRRVRGGNWDRISADPAILQRGDASMLEVARAEAEGARENAAQWPPSWRDASLTSILAEFSAPRTGWSGERIEPWRISGMTVLEKTFVTQGHAMMEWLSGEVNVEMMRFQPSAMTKFWLNEVELLRMPRHWLRWAFEFLQSQYKVTPGTPADAQLGTYLVDVDLFLSADKGIVRIAQKCKSDAPFKLANSLLVPGGVHAVTAVVNAIKGELTMDTKA